MANFNIFLKINLKVERGAGLGLHFDAEGADNNDEGEEAPEEPGSAIKTVTLLGHSNSRKADAGSG